MLAGKKRGKAVNCPILQSDPDIITANWRKLKKKVVQLSYVQICHGTFSIIYVFRLSLSNVW